MKNKRLEDETINIVATTNKCMQIKSNEQTTWEDDFPILNLKNLATRMLDPLDPGLPSNTITVISKWPQFQFPARFSESYCLASKNLQHLVLTWPPHFQPCAMPYKGFKQQWILIQWDKNKNGCLWVARRLSQFPPVADKRKWFVKYIIG